MCSNGLGKKKSYYEKRGAERGSVGKNDLGPDFSRGRDWVGFVREEEEEGGRGWMGWWLHGSRRRRRLRRGCRWSCRLDSPLDFGGGDGARPWRRRRQRWPVGVGALGVVVRNDDCVFFSPGRNFIWIRVGLSFESGIWSGLLSCVSFGFRFGFGGDGFDMDGRRERER